MLLLAPLLALLLGQSSFQGDDGLSSVGAVRLGFDMPLELGVVEALEVLQIFGEYLDCLRVCRLGRDQRRRILREVRSRDGEKG